MEELGKPVFHPLGECDADQLRVEELVIGFDGIGMDWLNNETAEELGEVVEAITISKFPVTGRGERCIGLLLIKGQDGNIRRYVAPDLGDRPIPFRELEMDDRL
jgi:hypothetical protein